ncbi:enoyl-CoA hydratase/isomerase family protein [Nocardia elegans]|uniref:enoyl-CoA hydratase/isomerase family protein n=1 Tax=Nocardia elegans TaxID=300029 RepID=UPI0018947222|nr:enoyl-CoA hydratase/isomerase family protein [Nocardia elegans]MBF6246641.1 enoyl-CoA hydratase/isomerase family protein [Nocardia elegans]
MTTGTSTVDLRVEAALATLTLRRAAASNALDLATKNDLLAAVTRIAADETVRAVLLTAEGKNFCVGQDLGEHVDALRADPATAMDTVGAHYNPLLRALADLPVPVVVAIRGACVGAGLGLALAADIRVAGNGAKFATAFTGIGLAADSGLSHTLVRALGASRAAGLMLLGDRFTAEQALAWGLIHRLVADDDVDATAAELATTRLPASTATGRVDGNSASTAAATAGQSRHHTATTRLARAAAGVTTRPPPPPEDRSPCARCPRRTRPPAHRADAVRCVRAAAVPPGARR